MDRRKMTKDINQFPEQLKAALEPSLKVFLCLQKKSQTSSFQGDKGAARARAAALSGSAWGRQLALKDAPFLQPLCMQDNRLGQGGMAEWVKEDAAHPSLRRIQPGS
ncbi:Hypothetical predicted protein [Marmota monax]|uniref:Uncharacterized protein n=1 Tax=Marmota monax TaxID=9995 RepID=A0A5E4CEW0_MARMO|nr:hypothetical protein GHT09_010656 [Marmota monax]VTJ80286.1 Hypothetical predicted protein [Marmota monax]